MRRDGCVFVKMKVGTNPEDDPRRVAVAKKAIGNATLFVDANGAYSVKQALELAARFAEQDVGWFEEPVSSDDLRGLRAIRETRAAPSWKSRPANMPTPPIMFARCWKRMPSTCSKPT